jgi:GNAT superfamily N-acetyltransferase
MDDGGNVVNNFDDPDQYVSWLKAKTRIGDLSRIRFGCHIHTSDEDTIQQNAAEAQIGVDWNQLARDVENIETNVIMMLTNAGLYVNDEGHGDSGERVCSVYLSNDAPARNTQMAQRIIDCTDEWLSTTSGTLEPFFKDFKPRIDPYQFVSELGKRVLDVSIEFTGTDALKEWFKLNIIESEDDVDAQDYVDSHTLDFKTPNQLSNFLHEINDPKSILTRTFAGQNDHYVDFDSYVVRHEDDSYSGWRFTVEFPEYPEDVDIGALPKPTLKLYGGYYLNAPDRGWTDEAPPVEDMPACKAHFKKFCAALREYTGITGTIEMTNDVVQESADLDAPDTYIENVHDLGDLLNDLTNYGLAHKRVSSYVEWVMVEGFSYWAEDENGKPLETEFFRNQLEKFCTDHKLTSYRIKMEPWKHVTGTGFSLLISKAQLTPESRMNYVNTYESQEDDVNAQEYVDTEVPVDVVNKDEYKRAQKFLNRWYVAPKLDRRGVCYYYPTRITHRIDRYPNFNIEMIDLKGFAVDQRIGVYRFTQTDVDDVERLFQPSEPPPKEWLISQNTTVASKRADVFNEHPGMVAHIKESEDDPEPFIQRQMSVYQSPFIEAMSAMATRTDAEEIDNAGTVQIDYHWTLPNGVKISGTPNKDSFHIDRLYVPKSMRKAGVARKWLAKLGELADQTSTKLTGTALPDEGSKSKFHQKWIKTMRDAGWETDIESLAFLHDEPEEEIRRWDTSMRDELVRFPRKPVRESFELPDDDVAGYIDKLPVAFSLKEAAGNLKQAGYEYVYCRAAFPPNSESNPTPSTIYLMEWNSPLELTYDMPDKEYDAIADKAKKDGVLAIRSACPQARKFEFYAPFSDGDFGLYFTVPPEVSVTESEDVDAQASVDAYAAEVANAYKLLAQQAVAEFDRQANKRGDLTPRRADELASEVSSQYIDNNDISYESPEAEHIRSLVYQRSAELFPADYEEAVEESAADVDDTGDLERYKEQFSQEEEASALLTRLGFEPVRYYDDRFTLEWKKLIYQGRGKNDPARYIYVDRDRRTKPAAGEYAYHIYLAYFFDSAYMPTHFEVTCDLPQLADTLNACIKRWTQPRIVENAESFDEPSAEGAEHLLNLRDMLKQRGYTREADLIYKIFCGPRNELSGRQREVMLGISRRGSIATDDANTIYDVTFWLADGMAWRDMEHEHSLSFYDLINGIDALEARAKALAKGPVAESSDPDDPEGIIGNLDANPLLTELQRLGWSVPKNGEKHEVFIFNNTESAMTRSWIKGIKAPDGNQHAIHLWLFGGNTVEAVVRVYNYRDKTWLNAAQDVNCETPNSAAAMLRDLDSALERCAASSVPPEEEAKVIERIGIHYSKWYDEVLSAMRFEP